MGNWCDISGDLLRSIEDLLSYSNKLRIRSVCKAWNLLLSRIPKARDSQMPLLLFPYTERKNNGCHVYPFFDWEDNKFYNIEIPIVGVGGGEKLFKGSCHGWIIMIEDEGTMFAFNPLTKAIRDLPHRKTFPDVHSYHLDKPHEEYSLFHYELDNPEEDCIDNMDLSHAHRYLTSKVVLSSNSIPRNNNDCIVVAIYGEYDKLAYCKFGDNKWSDVDGTYSYHVDLIFHKDKFYGLIHGGNVVVYEIGTLPWLIEVFPLPLSVYGSGSLYLVEYSGELMLVSREHHHITIDFTFYMLDMNRPAWIEDKSFDLEDNMLFLGYNSPLLVSSTIFSEYKGNSIYFTKNETIIGDQGIFDLHFKGIQPFPESARPRDESHLIVPIPIWVTLNPFDN